MVVFHYYAFFVYYYTLYLYSEAFINYTLKGNISMTIMTY